MPSSNQPPPCNPKVFQDGKPVMLVDTNCGAASFEAWVQQLQAEASAPTDWHYSGGIAQVLTLGDPGTVELAARRLWDEQPPKDEGKPMRVLRWCGGAEGLYRKDVTPVPDGAVAGFMDPVSGAQVFVVSDEA